MRLRMFQAIDRAAHFLYCPTMGGRLAARTRWHHRIHLIPGRLLGWICNRFDLFIGVEPEELHRPRKGAAEFYEEDESVADLIRAFDNAKERGRTAPPPVRREDV